MICTHTYNGPTKHIKAPAYACPDNIPNVFVPLPISIDLTAEQPHGKMFETREEKKESKEKPSNKFDT